MLFYQDDEWLVCGTFKVQAINIVYLPLNRRVAVKGGFNGFGGYSSVKILNIVLEKLLY